MSFNTHLSNRIREALSSLTDVKEKFMFGGVCYMVNDKMCMGVVGDELMCRINPDREEEALSMNNARQMDFIGKPMKGYIFVGLDGLRKQKDFEYWVELCLSFNAMAKKSKKAKKK